MDVSEQHGLTTRGELVKRLTIGTAERTIKLVKSPVPSTGASPAVKNVTLQGVKLSPVNSTSMGTVPASIPTITIRSANNLQGKTTPSEVTRSNHGSTSASKSKFLVDSVTSVAPMIVFPGQELSVIKNESVSRAKSLSSVDDTDVPILPGKGRPRLTKTHLSLSPKAISSDVTATLTSQSDRLQQAAAAHGQRYVQETLQRFVASPCKAGQSELTMCSACKKNVPFDRLAIHIAVEHKNMSVPPPVQPGCDTVEISERCPYCSKPIAKSILLFHIKRLHQLCSFCDQRFAASILPLHIERAHPNQYELWQELDPEEGGPQESVCDDTVDADERLLYAETSSNTVSTERGASPQFFARLFSADDGQLKCFQCSSRFSETSKLAEHLLEVHHLGDCCHICGMWFRLKQSLALHLRQIHAIKPATTATSAASYSVKGSSETKQHEPPRKRKYRKRATEMKQVEETYDDENGSDEPEEEETHVITKRKRDQVVGSEPAAFKCPNCGKTLTSQAQLDEHLKLHSNPLADTHDYSAKGVLNYSCDMCSKSFWNKGPLTMHKKYAHGNEGSLLYACEFCFEVFTVKKTLCHHIQTLHPAEISVVTTPLETHACDDCGRSFDSKHGLHMHQTVTKHWRKSRQDDHAIDQTPSSADLTSSFSESGKDSGEVSNEDVDQLADSGSDADDEEENGYNGVAKPGHDLPSAADKGTFMGADAADRNIFDLFLETDDDPGKDNVGEGSAAFDLDCDVLPPPLASIGLGEEIFTASPPNSS